jgi:hypothetical protein
MRAARAGYVSLTIAITIEASRHTTSTIKL